MATKTKLAVLEAACAKLPNDFDEIKGTLREMRDEAAKGRDKLYDHIDKVRKELREDIKERRRET